MFRKSQPTTRPLPREFLEWQVAVRLHTMLERNGAPHVGVAPLLTVKSRSIGHGFVSHSIICGLLPEPKQLEQKTKEFRALYENHIADGARAVYDKGIEYLKGYYDSADDFDDTSITTLLPKDLPVVKALRADPACALVFYVFDLQDRSEVGKLRCLQLDCIADVLEDGPVYDNVWMHNTLFHGAADEHAVLHFHHQRTHDTRFGALETIDR